MPVSKKPVKKPKGKVQKGTGVIKSHKGTGVSKIKQKQKQKQSVSVNVTIDQSKKGKSSSSSVSRMQQPANIINFPSNTPVSEIRYNPIIINPEKLQDNNKVVSETSLVKTEEKPKVYVNPNRPIISDNSILGTVADAGLQLGSYALKEKYPEYSELVDVGGQVTDYIGKKFISGDIQKAGEGLTKQVTKGYKYLFGKKKDSSTSMDAWDNLSTLSDSTHGNLAVLPSIAESKASSKSSSKLSSKEINIPKPTPLPRQVTIENSITPQINSNPLLRRVTMEGNSYTEVKPPNPLARRVTMDGENFSDYTLNTQFSGVNPLIEQTQTPILNKINLSSNKASSSNKKKPPSSSEDSGDETEIFIERRIPEGVGNRYNNVETQVSPHLSKNPYHRFLQNDIKGKGYTQQAISSMWAIHPDNKKNQVKK